MAEHIKRWDIIIQYDNHANGDNILYVSNTDGPERHAASLREAGHTIGRMTIRRAYEGGDRPYLTTGTVSGRMRRAIEDTEVMMWAELRPIPNINDAMEGHDVESVLGNPALTDISEDLRYDSELGY